MEVKHQSTPVPWLGLGPPEGLQGCCQLPGCLSCGIDRAWQSDGHGPAFPAGSLGNEPGHWGSTGGYLGQRWPQRHGATSEILRAGMLAPLPLARTWSPRGRGGHILPLWGDSDTGSPRGTVQGIVQRSASAPQNTPLPEVLTLQPVMLMGGGAAPKSLQQQWGHSTFQGSMGC